MEDDDVGTSDEVEECIVTSFELCEEHSELLLGTQSTDVEIDFEVLFECRSDGAR